MHEIGVVEDIFSAIRAQLKERGEDSTKVKRVNILIGELEHIAPDHFEFHFREKTKGTSLGNAELNFRKIEARFRCKDCGCEFKAKNGIAGCPKCRSNVNDVVAGRGVCVESIEVD